MQRVNAKEFKAHYGQYTEAALMEPVVIQKHHRDSVVLMSYKLYEDIERIMNSYEDLVLASKMDKAKKSGKYILGNEAIKRLEAILNDAK